MELTAATIAELAGGDVVAGSPDARARSYTIDSRRADAGSCFFAIEAARDGHDFVADAAHRGATVAVVHREPRDAGDLAVVRVDDTVAALQTLGRAARDRLDAVVVGITGSAGKTATKDLLAAAVAGSRRVHASHASYNNETGLPLTLLDADEDAEVVVAEMGARFAGNIAELAAIARPQVGVVTHIGLAHAEHLGGRAGIEAVKGELLDALPADGLAVLNDRCEAAPRLAARTAARVVRVGDAETAEVRFRDVVLDPELRPRFTLDSPWGTAPVQLELHGAHQVENAAMAAAVALWLGVPIDAVAGGLAGARTAERRMELSTTPDGIVVLNDAYNSSPTSLAAAVRSFVQLECAGRRIAVLGGMLELGEHAAGEHVALGMLAAEHGIELVIAVGPHAEHLAEGARTGGSTVVAVVDADAAVLVALSEARPGDAVLVKASRAVGLEQVAVALRSGARR